MKGHHSLWVLGQRQSAPRQTGMWSKRCQAAMTATDKIRSQAAEGHQRGPGHWNPWRSPCWKSTNPADCLLLDNKSTCTEKTSVTMMMMFAIWNLPAICTRTWQKVNQLVLALVAATHALNTNLKTPSVSIALKYAMLFNRLTGLPLHRPHSPAPKRKTASQFLSAAAKLKPWLDGPTCWYDKSSRSVS